jgi:hypothetical protein
MFEERKTLSFLDETWFYTTSHIRKIKNLTFQPHEARSAGTLRRRKVVSKELLTRLFFHHN